MGAMRRGYAVLRTRQQQCVHAAYEREEVSESQYEIWGSQEACSKERCEGEEADVEGEDAELEEQSLQRERACAGVALKPSDAREVQQAGGQDCNDPDGVAGAGDAVREDELSAAADVGREN